MGRGLRALASWREILLPAEPLLGQSDVASHLHRSTPGAKRRAPLGIDGTGDAVKAISRYSG